MNDLLYGCVVLTDEFLRSRRQDDVEIPSEPEVQLRNVSGKVITNNKGNSSPCSPLPYHTLDTQNSSSEPLPIKRRRCRENSSGGHNAVKSSRHHPRASSSPKDTDNGQVVADPVEIIPLMPNLKLEMPEYLEQDGSSCSYEEQSIGESKMLDDSADPMDTDQKPDIGQTFYSNTSGDTLDASKSSDLG